MISAILVSLAFAILLALLWCIHKITRAVYIKRFKADNLDDLLDDLLDDVVKMKYDIFQIRDRISKILEQDGLVVRFEDSGCKIVYCPSLDVAGYGRTDEEAEESFRITLEETLKYINERKESNMK